MKKTVKSREERLTTWWADFSNVFEVWGDVSSLSAEDASFLEDQRTIRCSDKFILGIIVLVNEL